MIGGSSMAVLRLNDISRRGAIHTIYPAAKQFGVSGNTMYDILSGIYNQLGAIDESSEEGKRVIADNPEYPKVLQKEEWWLTDRLVEEAVQCDLLKEVEDGYALTEKAISVFQRAAELNKVVWGT